MTSISYYVCTTSTYMQYVSITQTFQHSIPIWWSPNGAGQPKPICRQRHWPACYTHLLSTADARNGDMLSMSAAICLVALLVVRLNAMRMAVACGCLLGTHICAKLGFGSIFRNALCATTSIYCNYKSIFIQGSMADNFVGCIGAHLTAERLMLMTFRSAADS